jgi:hypothetical protein
MENTSGESGVQWIPVFCSNFVNDPETGLHSYYADLSQFIKREPLDPGVCDYIKSPRLDIETARRWDIYEVGPIRWESLDMLLTYHTITYGVSGTITGSAGGTVNISAWDTTLKELRGTTSRVGNGSYFIMVYDSAHDFFVEAAEDATHNGRSATGKTE